MMGVMREEEGDWRLVEISRVRVKQKGALQKKSGDGWWGTFLVYVGFGEPEGWAVCILVGAP